MRRNPWIPLLCALLWAAPGCGVDAESDTGLLVVVTLDDSALVDGEGPALSTLRFYVAAQVNAENDVWVLNKPLEGLPVDVAARDLKAEPYRFFLAENGDGQMERLQVLVVAEKDGERRLFGRLENPTDQTLQRGQILQRTIALRPDAEGLGLTWTVSGCLLSADGSIRFGSAQDRDCDGHLSPDFGGEDCDDEDPAVNPAAPDDNDCDHKDNNCDGIVDPGGNDDRDGDGVTACQGDCDDNDPLVYPGAEERCNGKDDNCNGKCDEGQDADGDGYTPCGTLLVDEGKQCLRVPFGDCDDQNGEVHPGAEERCNGVDDNCNGRCDEGTDPDQDGYNACGSIPGEVLVEGDVCTPPAPERIDCAPEDSAIHPYAPERCDGLDNDCNSETSAPPTLCYAWETSPGTGRCLQGLATCTESGGSGQWSECVTDVATADPASPVMCAAWDLCASSPDPAACLGESVSVLDLSCAAHMLSGENMACWEEPPTYYLPLGISTLAGSCTWTLQLDYNATGWQQIGLVDPYNPGQPSSQLHACEAALVARPAPFDGTVPTHLTGTLSFVHAAAQETVLVLMPFEIGADHDCGFGESLTCTLAAP